MQIHLAHTLDEVRDVEPLGSDDAWAARKFLEALPDDPSADHLRWLEDEGRPVACVQVFLHRYPIGQASLGVCLPEYPYVPPELRGRGYFKRLMADLLAWLPGAGYPLAYSHGRKGLYSARGYAPCFHHCMVLIRVTDAARVQANGRAEQAGEADVAAHAELFRRPFPLGRGLQCRDERWRPDPACVRLVRAEAGAEIRGFAVLAQVIVGKQPDGGNFAAFAPVRADAIVTVTDAWAADLAAAAVLLRTVADEAAALGIEWIRINARRDDVLARLAVLAGGELRWSAAQERDCTESGEDVDAFYLADLRLALRQLLPELNARWRAFSGQAPPAVRLCMEEQAVGLSLQARLEVLDAGVDDAPCIRLPRKAMTRAVLGYASPAELSVLHDGCELPDSCRAVAEGLLPVREPHLIHENLAFAAPADFGLVP